MKHSIFGSLSGRCSSRIVLLIALVGLAAGAGRAQVAADVQGDDLSPQCYLPLLMRPEDPECPPECQEPNDDPVHACTVLEPGVRCGGMAFPAGSQGVHDDLADWYSIEVDHTASLVLSLDGPDGADFDLLVYGSPPGEPLAWGDSQDADEELTLAVSAGRYYVVPTRVSGSGEYRLVLSW